VELAAFSVVALRHHLLEEDVVPIIQLPFRLLDIPVWITNIRATPSLPALPTTRDNHRE